MNQVDRAEPSADSGPDMQLYARSFADVYDQWYHDLDDPDVLVRAFRRQCADGARIIELGSGTGRLAAPLHAAGFHVVGIDVSHQMLAAAPAGAHGLAADMTSMALAEGCVDAVLIAYNTLLNLDSHTQQQQCFDEIARVLRGGGVAAIEAFIADADNTSPFGVSVRRHPSRPGDRLAIVTGPDVTDPDVIVGSHIELGSEVVCRPWRLLYQSPEQLDVCASRAGLALKERHGDWSGTRFDAHSHRHVSWYEPT